MKLLLFLSLFFARCLAPLPLAAQGYAANTLQLSTGLDFRGYPWVLSGSYERLVSGAWRSNVQVLARLGLGNHRELWDPSGFPSLLGGMTLLIDQDRDGSGANYWEVSLGGIGWLERETELRLKTMRPYLELGYRHQPPRGGWLFRVYLGTMGGGVGVGYTFGR